MKEFFKKLWESFKQWFKKEGKDIEIQLEQKIVELAIVKLDELDGKKDNKFVQEVVIKDKVAKKDRTIILTLEEKE